VLCKMNSYTPGTFPSASQTSQAAKGASGPKSHLHALSWSAWLVVVALVPVIPRTPLDGIFHSGRLANYLWTDLIVVGIFLWLALNTCNLRGLVARHRPIVKIYGGLLGLFLLQRLSLFVHMLRGEPMSFSDLWAGLEWLKVLVLLFLACELVRSLTRLRRVWLVFITGFLIVCAIGLAEASRNAAVAETLDSLYGTPMHVAAAEHLATLGQMRITATFDRNPHGFSLYLLLGLTVIASVQMHRGRVRMGARVFLGVLFCLGLYELLASAVLNALLAAALSLCVVVLYRATRTYGRVAIAAGMVLVIGLACVTIAATGMPILQRAAAIWEQMAAGGLNQVDDVSINARYAAIKDILSYLVEHPVCLLFGVSPSTLVELVTERGLYADNEYVFTMLTLGLPGLLMFLWTLGQALHTLHVAIASSPIAGPERTLFVSSQALLCGMAMANLGGPFWVGEGFARTVCLEWSFIGIALGFTTVGSGRRA
jgi:O-antigen ligase/polysaccharide polymerase Wzy-like membrane protein